MNISNSELTNFTQNKYHTTSSTYEINKCPKKLWQEIQDPAIVEISVNTEKNLFFYPRHVETTGIDLSPAMLEQALRLLSEKLQNRVIFKDTDAVHNVVSLILGQFAILGVKANMIFTEQN